MKLWAFGLTGTSVAAISAALIFFDKPEMTPEIRPQAQDAPAVLIGQEVKSGDTVQPDRPTASSAIAVASPDETMAVKQAATAVPSNSLQVANVSAVSEPEYVLCAVWFLGRFSDQLRGIEIADAASSHTVPLPGPVWLMHKLRSVSS